MAAPIYYFLFLSLIRLLTFLSHVYISNRLDILKRRINRNNPTQPLDCYKQVDSFKNIVGKLEKVSSRLPFDPCSLLLVCGPRSCRLLLDVKGRVVLLNTIGLVWMVVMIIQEFVASLS
jgi:hypothetical protein